MNDREDAALEAVEDALRTYPLTPAPPTLSQAVMARVRALAPAPRFRLQWIDYAISAFAAGMMGLALSLWQSITPQMAARAQFQVLLWMQHSGFQWWAGTLLAGLVLAGGALMLAALVLARSRTARFR